MDALERFPAEAETWFNWNELARRRHQSREAKKRNGNSPK